MKMLIVAAAIVAAAGVRADDSGGSGAKTLVVKSAQDLTFKAVPGANGVSTAVLWGDPDQGAYGAFAKFPAGLRHPLHTHTNDIKGVVLRGTWLAGPDEASVKEYGPGTYFLTPGGVKHISGCKEGAECMIFQESPGKFDMTPVEGRKLARP